MRDRDIPDCIPADVTLRVIVVVHVEFDAGRIDREVKRGAPVVKGVEHHVHPIGGDVRIPARQWGEDAVRRVVGAHADINGVAHKDDTRFGASRRGNTTLRVVLREIGGDRCRQPNGVIEVTVEYRRNQSLGAAQDAHAGGARFCRDAGLTKASPKVNRLSALLQPQQHQKKRHRRKLLLVF